MSQNKQAFRIFTVFCLMLLAIAVLTACNSGDNPQTEANTDTNVSSSSEINTTAELESETMGESSGETYTAEQAVETTAEEVTLPDMPLFSQDGGIYKSGTEISLSLPDTCSGKTIRYTTDGNVPTKKSSEYKKPVKVDKTTVIRAAIFNGSDIIGCVATNTYIITDEQPVAYTVSITANTKEYDKMVSNATKDIEIAAHIEIIAKDGERVISQDGGLKVFGGSSRGLQQKSFKIIARKPEKLGESYYYGTGNFKYAFFEQRTVRSGKNEGKVLEKYDSLILRNGGNDSIQHSSVNPEQASLLRDNLANNLAAEVTENLDYACSEFAEVYVNGEYYGILDMKENMNEDYVRRVYGVDDKDVVVVKSELDTSRGQRFDGTWFFLESDNQAELDSWSSLCNKAIKNINSKNYDSVYEEIAAKVDIDSFIKYIAYGIYTCNTDWPHNNVKFWRYTGEAIDGIEITDGKWRFMTRDMDMAFGRYDSADILPELDNTFDVDTFYRILGNYYDYSAYFENSGETELYKDSLGLQGLFAFFLKNSEFREKFTAYCEKLASEETTDKLLSIYQEQYDVVKALIPDHLARWKGTYPSSYTNKTWTSAAKDIKTFANKRSQYFTKYLNRMLSIVKGNL